MMNKPPKTLSESIAAYKRVHDTQKETAAQIEAEATEHVKRANANRVAPHTANGAI